MDKLSFQLENFEGPLDLLLYLISKNKLNILDIPITELLNQYMEAIRAMQQADMDVASEFLEMASRLVYLKTVSLLPRHEEAEQLRDQLAGELLEYEAVKAAAANLGRHTEGFDRIARPPAELPIDHTYSRRHQSLELLSAYLSAAGRGQRRLPPPVSSFHGIVQRRIISVSSKIVFVLRRLWKSGRVRFSALYERAESRSELVATFLAVLELMKARRVTVSGDGADARITILKTSEVPSSEHETA